MLYLVLLLTLLPLAASCAVQLFLLRRTKHRLRPLRFLPLLAVAYLCLHAWNVFRTPSMFGNLGDLEGVAALVVAGAILLGWALAWWIHRRFL